MYFLFVSLSISFGYKLDELSHFEDWFFRTFGLANTLSIVKGSRRL